MVWNLTLHIILYIFYIWSQLLRGTLCNSGSFSMGSIIWKGSFQNQVADLNWAINSLSESFADIFVGATNTSWTRSDDNEAIQEKNREIERERGRQSDREGGVKRSWIHWHGHNDGHSTRPNVPSCPMSSEWTSGYRESRIQNPECILFTQCGLFFFKLLL